MHGAEPCQAFQITIQITGPHTLGAHTRVWECHLLVIAPGIDSARVFARLYATSLFSNDVVVKIARARRAGGPAFSAAYPRVLAGRANLVDAPKAASTSVEPSEGVVD